MALRVFINYGGHPALVMHAEEDHGAVSPRRRHPGSDISPNQHQRSSIFSSTPHRQTPGAAGDSGQAYNSSISPQSMSPLADISHISFASHGQPIIDGLRLRPSNRSRAIFTFFARVVFPIWRKKVCILKDDKVASALFPG